jgi:DNA end-binding protein Ku
MVGRPFWSGQLKISLVSFGIQLYPAVNTRAGVTFHQIDRDTGQRVRHRNVINESEPVENAEIAKGYEYSKGKYIAIDPEEIRKLRIATKSVIEVKQFVPLNDLPPALFEKPYYVVPDPRETPEAFAVVRKAMEQVNVAALGEVTFSGREHLMAFAVPSSSDRGMMAYTLRYADELRKADDYFSGIADATVDKKQLAMASDLVQAYSSPLHLESFKDDYEAALRELVEAKEKNLPLPLEEEKPQRSTKVVGLMDALRRSLSEVKKPEGSSRKRAAKDAPKKGPVLVKGNKRKHKAA